MYALLVYYYNANQRFKLSNHSQPAAAINQLASPIRLFKATRRTIRAELTLIIVIVISFSWSAYALYKLFVTNTDSSLFGLNFSLTSPAHQINSSAGSVDKLREPPTTISEHQQVLASSTGKHQHWHPPSLVVTPSVPVSDSLSKQLAAYKKQILKELLARQRRLLSDDGADEDGSRSTSFLGQNVTEPTPAINLSHYDFPKEPPDHDQATGAFVSENRNNDKLQQWRGGYNLPSSLDYLFDNRQHDRPQRQHSVILEDKLPLGSNNAHSVVRLNRNNRPNNNLLHLTGGPSLMQLNPTRSAISIAHSSSSGREPTTLSEPNLDHEEEDSVGQSQEDNLDNESARQLTTTTTEAPPVPTGAGEEILSETTTSEPSLAMLTSTTTTDSPSVQQADQETTSTVADADDGETPAEGASGPEDHEDNDSESPKLKKSRTSPSDESRSSEEVEGGRRAADTVNGNTDDNEDDAASMERVKNTVHAIDEEVDRMTQPSLGMASQQDKTFDLKNMVQFDDNLAGSSGASEPALTSPPYTRNSTTTRPTRLIDQILEPGDKRQRKLRSEDGGTTSTGEPDLLVADDRAKPPVSRADMDSQAPQRKQRLNQKLAPAAQADLDRVDEPRQRAVNRDLGATILQLTTSKGAGSEGKLTNTKRSQASRENRPNSSESGLARKRSKRSEGTNPIGQTLDLIDARSKRTDKQVKKRNDERVKWRQGKDSTSRSRTSLRRSDDDDGNEDDDEEEEHQEEHPGVDEDVGQSGRAASSASDGPTGYQYITSNDPSLQELLAHKQLLDALQQSRLPSPVSNKPHKSAGSLDQQQQRLNSTFIGPPVSAGQERGSPSQRQHSDDPDREHAHSHYTIDEGLLLTPASDEERQHHSMSKKSGKASEEKHKKKSTVAIKKGGHKKKKHKKEEKKYVKEKKFKGAKKGKKMAKGKGGKGGKKGKKFYKDKGFKKKGFKNIYVKNEFGQKKEYFDEFRDKDFKKKWKNFDDKYKYAQMKKWQAKDVKGAKKMKDHSDKFKKYDKGKWKKKYHKHQASEWSKKKSKKYDEF